MVMGQVLIGCPDQCSCTLERSYHSLVGRFDQVDVLCNRYSAQFSANMSLLPNISGLSSEGRNVKLSIEQMFIEELPASIFGQQKLISLRLLNNPNLKSIDGNIFERAKDYLKYFALLNHDSLESFDMSGLSKCRKLEKLALQLKRPFQEPVSNLKLKSLQHLVSLSLYGDSFRQLLPEVSTLTNLTQLTLTGMGLGKTTIPHGLLSSLPNLATLNLASNNFDVIPPEIMSQKNLKVLSLENNELLFNSDLPLLDSMPNNVEVLNLRSNRFRSIPCDVFKLPNLRYLKLSSKIICFKCDEDLELVQRLNQTCNTVQTWFFKDATDVARKEVQTAVPVITTDISTKVPTTTTVASTVASIEPSDANNAADIEAPKPMDRKIHQPENSFEYYDYSNEATNGNEFEGSGETGTDMNPEHSASIDRQIFYNKDTYSSRRKPPSQSTDILTSREIENLSDNIGIASSTNHAVRANENSNNNSTGKNAQQQAEFTSIPSESKPLDAILLGSLEKLMGMEVGEMAKFVSEATIPDITRLITGSTSPSVGSHITSTFEKITGTEGSKFLTRAFPELAQPTTGTTILAQKVASPAVRRIAWSTAPSDGQHITSTSGEITGTEGSPFLTDAFPKHAQATTGATILAPIAASPVVRRIALSTRLNLEPVDQSSKIPVTVSSIEDSRSTTNPIMQKVELKKFSQYQPTPVPNIYSKPPVSTGSFNNVAVAIDYSNMQDLPREQQNNLPKVMNNSYTPESHYTAFKSSPPEQQRTFPLSVSSSIRPEIGNQASIESIRGISQTGQQINLFPGVISYTTSANSIPVTEKTLSQQAPPSLPLEPSNPYGSNIYGYSLPIHHQTIPPLPSEKQSNFYPGYVTQFTPSYHANKEIVFTTSAPQKEVTNNFPLRSPSSSSLNSDSWNPSQQQSTYQNNYNSKDPEGFAPLPQNPFVPVQIPIHPKNGFETWEPTQMPDSILSEKQTPLFETKFVDTLVENVKPEDIEYYYYEYKTEE